jgi:anti-anti-sigma factor
MRGSGLSVDWERRGSTAQLVLDGELDGEAAEALAHRAVALLDDDPAELVVDMSGVTLCDCAGITALFRMNGRAEERGIQFVLRNLNASVYRAFDGNRSTSL